MKKLQQLAFFYQALSLTELFCNWENKQQWHDQNLCFLHLILGGWQQLVAGRRLNIASCRGGRWWERSWPRIASAIYSVTVNTHQLSSTWVFLAVSQSITLAISREIEFVVFTNYCHSELKLHHQQNVRFSHNTAIE